MWDTSSNSEQWGLNVFIISLKETNELASKGFFYYLLGQVFKVLVIFCYISSELQDAVTQPSAALGSNASHAQASSHFDIRAAAGLNWTHTRASVLRCLIFKLFISLIVLYFNHFGTRYEEQGTRFFLKNVILFDV